MDETQEFGCVIESSFSMLLAVLFFVFYLIQIHKTSLSSRSLFGQATAVCVFTKVILIYLALLLQNTHGIFCDFSLNGKVALIIHVIDQLQIPFMLQESEQKGRNNSNSCYEVWVRRVAYFTIHRLTLLPISDTFKSYLVQSITYKAHLTHYEPPRKKVIS